METIIIAILGVVVIAAVAVPLLRGGRGGHHDAREYEVHAGTSTSPAGDVVPAAFPADRTFTEAGGDGAIEAEVARYRAAVAAGTVCARCGEANAPGARYCGDCGKPLSAANEDAREFA